MHAYLFFFSRHDVCLLIELMQIHDSSYIQIQFSDFRWKICGIISTHARGVMFLGSHYMKMKKYTTENKEVIRLQVLFMREYSVEVRFRTDFIANKNSTDNYTFINFHILKASHLILVNPTKMFLTSIWCDITQSIAAFVHGDQSHYVKLQSNKPPKICLMNSVFICHLKCMISIPKLHYEV